MILIIALLVAVVVYLAAASALYAVLAFIAVLLIAHLSGRRIY